MTRLLIDLPTGSRSRQTIRTPKRFVRRLTSSARCGTPLAPEPDTGTKVCSRHDEMRFKRTLYRKLASLVALAMLTSWVAPLAGYACGDHAEGEHPKTCLCPHHAPPASDTGASASCHDEPAAATSRLAYSQSSPGHCCELAAAPGRMPETIAVVTSSKVLDGFAELAARHHLSSTDSRPTAARSVPDPTGLATPQIFLLNQALLR